MEWAGLSCRRRKLCRCAAFWLGCVLVTASLGCHRGPTAIRPPKIDSARAADAAIEQYDQDADGLLSEAELAACPGILGQLRKYDQDQDRRVSAAEIAARIGQWQDRGTGLRAFSCGVSLEGRPLFGAQVRLTPETFLGENLKSASGTVADFGQAVIRIAPEELPEDQKDIPGVQLGLYKVQITHPTVELPARYNTETTLGVEIGEGGSRTPVVFALKKLSQ